MIVSMKDGARLFGISIMTCCAVTVCNLFLNYYLDLTAVAGLIGDSYAKMFYDAQVMTAKVVCGVAGGCLAATTVVMLVFYIKHYIGELSAFCGAVSAGAGAGAGLAWLRGGRYEMIAHTVVNAVAVTSGIICDGAKASCAAKIASAVDAGLLGLAMYEDGNQFFGGDGIVKRGVENTIRAVGQLARVGMEQTDREIIQLMLDPVSEEQETR